jgi:hypothetical protein
VSDDGATRAAAWLSAWDSLGIHRTATPGDEAGATWLRREAAGLGAAPAAEDFALDRLDPVAAYFECDGERIPGVPVFDSPGTGADGIAGILEPIGGPVSGQATIAVAELSPFSVYSPDYEEVRRDPACCGLVILCKGAQPGLGLLNAERFGSPYGAPAIHVASEARDAVFAAAARRAPARLIAASRRTPARARNTVVMIRGRDRARTPVGHDAAQLVVAIDLGTWWRARLLARIIARPNRLPASLRCEIHRQQRPRARSSGSRRIHDPPPRLGAASRSRRRRLDTLRRQYRGGRRRAFDTISE